MPPVPLLCLALIALMPAVLPTNAEPGLPAPSNVRIDSYNMQHVVRWDPVDLKDEPMPVMYSVAFKIDGQTTGTADQNYNNVESYNKLQELCTNIPETECDVTSKIPQFYRGKPMVRAELGSRTSDWVVLPDFQPNRNTTIGPVKSLVLHSHSSKLTVDFSPPFSPIPSSWEINYNLSYWKENSEKKETVNLTSTSVYTLDNLESNTNYCVQVYAFTRYSKGLVSNPVCETTSKAIISVVLGCVFSFVFLFGIISLLVIPDKPIHKALSRIKIWLTGPYRIPSHILEYLEDPPPSVNVECPQNTFEEQYDNISIVSMDLCQDNEETSPEHSQHGPEKT